MASSPSGNGSLHRRRARSTSCDIRPVFTPRAQDDPSATRRSAAEMPIGARCDHEFTVVRCCRSGAHADERSVPSTELHACAEQSGSSALRHPLSPAGGRSMPIASGALSARISWHQASARFRVYDHRASSKSRRWGAHACRVDDDPPVHALPRRGHSLPALGGPRGTAWTE